MGAFRDFLEELREAGELNVIQEKIDWDLQAAAICAMSQRTGGPAVQFNNLKDFGGISLAGSLLSGPGFMEWPQVPRRMHGRIAVALGLPPDTHYTEVLETVIDRMDSPIRAVEVERGPCQEVVIEGEDVDLFKYPIPRIHDKDGGRYLTFHTVLVRDEDKAWTNMGTYRLQLAGRDALVHGGIPRRTQPSHFEQIIRTYHGKGQAAPFAVVLGPPPEMMMASALSSPEGTDEYALAGGLALNSIPLVKGRLSNLMVPANAEVVLEGHIYPGDVAEEGPFGGISYYLERSKNNLVLRVECITQRKEPILPFVAESAKPSDTICLFSLLHSAELERILRKCGLPVKWLVIPVEARLCLGVVSLATQPIPGLPGRAAQLMVAYSPFVRKVLVVDRDLDSEDLPTMITDRNFKASAERHYFISPKIDKPLGWTENHSFTERLGSWMVIDATWRNDRDPATIPRRTTFEVCFPDEVRKKVISNWNEKWKLTPKAYEYEIK
jgi:4-hydroxy-3-polyprenylbenzoate decarboxylase